MRKLFLIVIVLIGSMLFTAASCQQTKNTTAFDPFVGGTEGITIEFQNGNPTDQILDKGLQPFGVGVILKNKGEYSFDPANADFAKLSLQGINPAYFGNPQIEKVLDFPLRGVKKNSVDGTTLAGEEQVYTFENFNYMNDLAGNDVLKLRAQLCYDYQTKVSTKICIKPNQIETSSNTADALCLLNEVKDPKNSGAPVHVSTLSENPNGPSKVQVMFTVSHVGTGEIYKLGSAKLCDNSITNMDKNQVYVTVALPEGTQAVIKCPRLSDKANTAGFITLFDGIDQQISCTIDTGTSTSTYEPILGITLDYLYANYVDKQITVVDTGT